MTEKELEALAKLDKLIKVASIQEGLLRESLDRLDKTLKQPPPTLLPRSFWNMVNWFRCESS